MVEPFSRFYPGCSTEDLGEIDSEPLAGSGSVFLPSIIYRTAVGVARSAASTRALALLVSVTHVDEWSEQLVGYFIQCAPALLVWSLGLGQVLSVR